MPLGTIATLHTYIPVEGTKEVVDLRDPRVATMLLKNEKVNSQVNLLFLGGFPSAQWLVNIGSACRLDPEFVRRHLTFELEDYNFTLPSLPSHSDNMIKLRYTTIGMRRHDYGPPHSLRDIFDEKAALKNKNRYTSQSFVEAPSFAADLERAASSGSYYYNGRSHSNPKKEIGESLIRSIAVHNDSYFSIEQEISIYVKKNPGRPGWLGISGRSDNSSLKLANETNSIYMARQWEQFGD